MGTKRSHEDANPQEARSEKRQASTGLTKKPRYTPGGSRNDDKRPRHKPAPAPNPLNPLKARIRSLRRLLAHDDNADTRAAKATAHMHPDRSAAILHDADELEVADKHSRRDEKRVKRLPAGIRLEHERELKGLEEKVAGLTAKKKRADCITRWHKIRFFERRKAERRMKKLAKEGKDVHAAEVDLNYALYFPLEKDYVPLWPRKKDAEEEEAEDERKGDREMWLLVERCMKKGTLDHLREGRVDDSGQRKTENKAPTEKKKPKAVALDEDSDSDGGGFFEK